VKKGRGNGVVRALGETRDEFDAFWIDGPTGTNSDDDEAHTGGKITVLMAARVRGNSQVSREARTVSVVSSDVRWASGVEGLDVNQEVGACPVIITEDDVGGMANPSAVAERVEDVMLVCAAACRSVGKVAILEGEDPCPDVVPHSRHASIVSHVMV
jgi:hypothetical protein